jgi:hypothetical protein
LVADRRRAPRKAWRRLVAGDGDGFAGLGLGVGALVGILDTIVLLLLCRLLVVDLGLASSGDEEEAREWDAV